MIEACFLSILAALVLGAALLEWYKTTKRKWGENE